MNTHQHARLTFLRRLEMVQQLLAKQLSVCQAARSYSVTAPTVRKWLGRLLALGQPGLADASSRPAVSPRAIAPAKALAGVEWPRKRLTQARIAQALDVSASTVAGCWPAGYLVWPTWSLPIRSCATRMIARAICRISISRSSGASCILVRA